ncbi:MAG: FAD-binding oxidoreductase [Rhodocyclaceae bacterium]|nr:FAD-binding oxidoreductase [Rhodocyclaceae bacterium]
MTDTLSIGPRRRFWGWGNAADVLSTTEQEGIKNTLSLLRANAEGVASPQESDVLLRASRGTPPSSLHSIFSNSHYDRLTHSYGKSFADLLRMWQRVVPNPPDWVAFPNDEQSVVDLLDWASTHNVAVIPFGGGTSVCGGVEPAVGESYAATVSLDLQRLNRVLEIDTMSRAALIQAGAFGPDLEAQLKPHGLTMRHYPQSFQFSTLGGWIATRAGGHYATGATHIDDMVEATRTVTPAGILQTRRLPASGAGPAPDRLIIGSEGTCGVITEAWMRLQTRPTFRASASAIFADMKSAVQCVRMLAQSGLNPSNCRLLDADEVANFHIGDGKSPTLVLGFESADHAVNAAMQRALEIVSDCGGSYDASSVNQSMQNSEGARSGAAGAWRDTFIRMPYLRDPMIGRGAILDTFETAITWDKFDAFYAGVKEGMQRAIKKATGNYGLVSCRFTHVYADGVAPYFTFSALGSASANLDQSLAAWCEIKRAANDLVVGLGGTSTHHHAVGRDHRSGYEVESAPLFRSALAGAKAVLDPQGVMNPGVLIDPAGRKVGMSGILAA